MNLSAKQKQIHRYREQTHGYHRGKDGGGKNWEVGIATCTLRCIKWIPSENLGFPVGSVVKNMLANAGDTGSIPRFGRSPEKEMELTPIVLPVKSHGQRDLVGYIHGVARVRNN